MAATAAEDPRNRSRSPPLRPTRPSQLLRAAPSRGDPLRRAPPPIDTSKNSEAMRTLSNAVVSLAWRSPTGSPAETCHWADGHPLNVHLYLALLRSIFDLRDEAAVLEEVDEMLELMKKTWAVLGINKAVHGICFVWVLFEQYIRTGRIEEELLGAALVVLGEVAVDAKRPELDPGFVRLLEPVLSSMLGWVDKQMMDYHVRFRKCSIGLMEKVLALALTTSKIMSEDLRGLAHEDTAGEFTNKVTSRVERYIRSSLKSAFTKLLENGNGKVDSMVVEVDEEPSETLVHLAKDTESLIAMEKETYGPVLRRWHPGPQAVAVATLHDCYGIFLKQYLARISGLNNETVKVLQTAGKLEKTLVQMVVEDSANCDDGGKAIVRR
ncbi:hypothetical protein HPP92_025532 [Vanilla planifolia]|uniref:Uncharacterized protein n=1 Tax=Vanilla planifolia TaxID=51239 RepID=A0A835PKB5_VANPL|nr:hypothetical protein HPP92_025532 [Vanilla planifolia]